MYGEVISVFLNMTLYLKPIMSVFVWVNVVVEPPITTDKTVLNTNIGCATVVINFSCHDKREITAYWCMADLAGSTIWYTTPWRLVEEANVVVRMYSSPSSSSPNERICFALSVPTNSPVHTPSSPMHSSCCCHSPDVLFSRSVNNLLVGPKYQVNIPCWIVPGNLPKKSA